MSIKNMNDKHQLNKMASNIESISKEIKTIKSELADIKKILREDFDLSQYAKKQLSIARKTPLKKYVDLDEI